MEVTQLPQTNSDFGAPWIATARLTSHRSVYLKAENQTMGRKFTDRDGNPWLVREDSRDRWKFEPLQGNRQSGFDINAPGYSKDPYELSTEEMQRILDANQITRRQPKKSPFLD